MIEDKDARERNNGTVPMSVVDKFLTLNQANNQAYSEIVGVLDTLSANVLDMRNMVAKLDDQIESEQLAEVMNLCTANIQDQVEKISELVTSMSNFHCDVKNTGVFTALSDYLRVHNIKDNEFAQMVTEHLKSPLSSGGHLETVEWILSTANGIKCNWGKLMAVFGATLAFIYLNGGKALLDLLAKFKG